MAKIRGIKPETWTDETFVELTPLARLLFIGMWNYACDNGHLEDRSKQLKMRLLPADDCNVAELIRELESHGRIVREEGWITVPTLREHQRIDKRWFATCEKPGCVKPGTETANPEPESRGGHDVPTARARGGHAVGTTGPRDELSGVDGDGDGELISSGIADATREPDRLDVIRLCNHLADAIASNGVKRPAIGKSWHDAARLLLDRDGYTEAQAHWLIDHALADEFWRSNVLSMPTLRKQADRLRIKFAPTKPQDAPGIRYLPNGDVDESSLPPIEDDRGMKMRPRR
jgi:hypothetical protein